jgi:hypothetical protein
MVGIHTEISYKARYRATYIEKEANGKPAMTGDALAQLKDIHLPETIHWWPPAIGWWLFILMAITTTTAIIYWAIQRKKQQKYRKEAIVLLDKRYQHWRVSNNNAHCFNAINALLKRTALTAFPESDATALHGQQWLDFLNGKCRSKPFSQKMINDFSQCQYQYNITIDIEQFYHCSRQWISCHANI